MAGKEGIVDISAVTMKYVVTVENGLTVNNSFLLNQSILSSIGAVKVNIIGNDAKRIVMLNMKGAVAIVPHQQDIPLMGIFVCSCDERTEGICTAAAI